MNFIKLIKKINFAIKQCLLSLQVSGMDWLYSFVWNTCSKIYRSAQICWLVSCSSTVKFNRFLCRFLVCDFLKNGWFHWFHWNHPLYCIRTQFNKKHVHEISTCLFSRVRKIFLKTFRRILTHFSQCYISIPLKEIENLMVFWCFQGL